jgi:GT2 family glycosyltransferase
VTARNTSPVTEALSRSASAEGVRVSVAATILSFNSKGTLAQAIQAIRSQSVKPDQILIVDNGSTDGSVPHIRALSGVSCILLPENVGVGAGHNRSWSTVLANPDFDFIWALEHDSLPAPDCLERLLQTYGLFFRRGVPIAAVFPRQVHPGPADVQPKSVREGMSPPLPHRWLPYENRSLNFNGVLLSTDAVRRVGPLREDFFIGHEDREYALRLTEWGFAVLCDPLATVAHRNKGIRKRQLPGVVRLYYGKRNEVYLNAYVRRPSLVRIRTLLRLAGAILRTIIFEDQKLQRMHARIYATCDGLRGSLGQKAYTFLQETTGSPAPASAQDSRQDTWAL